MAKNGSVRGKRNNVRKVIDNYLRLTQTLPNNGRKNYVDDEQNCCVVYVTTLAIIRKTFYDSQALLSILHNHFIKFQLRDIYLNDQYRKELQERLDGKLILPSLFIDGHFIGSYRQIEILNETGELIELLKRFQSVTTVAIDNNDSDNNNDNQMAAANNERNGHQTESNSNDQIDSSSNTETNQNNNNSNCVRKTIMKTKPDCFRCGNRQFINCLRCHGSGRYIRHHFPDCSVGLKCTHCNRSGLIRCPDCMHSNERISSNES